MPSSAISTATSRSVVMMRTVASFAHAYRATLASASAQVK
jgi:hypothetical protein